MAEGEEEVKYASVVFKAGNNPPPAEKRGEETVYGEVKVQNETKSEDSAGRRRFQHLACCLGILCVILLGGIIGVCVYLPLIHESDSNRFKEVSTLLVNNTKLNLENANLTRDNKNLKDQLGNLTQAYNVSESNNKDLSAGVQELETEKKNLKQQIQNLTTKWNELSISRAQWSIDSYCLGNTDKKCKACQDGWLLTQPSCYAYNDAKSHNKKTWEEAQEDCRGKNSDLAVARDSEEKEAIKTNRIGNEAFWIGLRVVNKKWKWVDGSDLTERSWIDPPDPADGHCAVFGRNTDKWYSVRCGWTNQWICQKKALSV
ncbi:C-type lectin domain family 10 member A-like isoform X1 [Pseudochaenichthys georgianus]|uniref:C-type lectin domain family 10 member A-like isoform X1 n=1 Tax=Pseudochaenichthys georgianus TaxID=52239 RepID=UPI0039C0849D